MGDLLSLVKDFGMQAVITVAVLFGGWQMMCRMMNMMESSNKRWQDVTDKLTEKIEKQVQDNREAHQYIRSEHEKFAELQDTQTGVLRGIEQAVGRINGYKENKQ